MFNIVTSYLKMPLECQSNNHVLMLQNDDFSISFHCNIRLNQILRDLELQIISKYYPDIHFVTIYLLPSNDII